MANAFKALLESINAQISALNSDGFKIYDAENPEYFISNLRYDKDSDEIVFETMADKSKE